MCLILFAYDTAGGNRLVLAANRDEFYSRKTAAMHYWEDHPSLLAGRDLDAGGTWFAVHKNGTFAALTNYRDPASLKTDAPSRGDIIPQLLDSGKSIKQGLEDLQSDCRRFNGFNLLAWDGRNLYWFSNVTEEIQTIEPGIHGLSNHLLNTKWPKVQKGKSELGRAIGPEGHIHRERIFDFLKDTTRFADENLPDTGVGRECERMLSPVFITSETYGTRSSTLLVVDDAGGIDVTERSFDADNGNQATENRFRFTPSF